MLFNAHFDGSMGDRTHAITAAGPAGSISDQPTGEADYYLLSFSQKPANESMLYTPDYVWKIHILF